VVKTSRSAVGAGRLVFLVACRAAARVAPMLVTFERQPAVYHSVPGRAIARVRLEAHNEMVGILVHGNNHFILSGPLPDEGTALALARHWSLVQIGGEKSPAFEPWQIRTKEFRENLEWAVVVPGDRETSPGVVELLAELSARGVAIHRCSTGCW
jgi:hypothetical protein